MGLCAANAAAAVSWSMVVVADTHAWKAGANFNAMTQWILDNKDARKIKLVVHNGDLTIDNTDAEWEIEKASVSPLDNQMPYILAAGNHDYPGNATTRDATNFNTYFQLADNPLNNSATEGIVTVEYETGKLENTYSTFTAPDGRDMLVFSLEFAPRQQVVDWANSIAADPQYENHTAVLSTHAYMDLVSRGGRDSSRWNPHSYGVADIDPTNDPIHDGEELWQELVGVNGNFEMTFNGHYIGVVDYQASVGEEGNTVHEMVHNRQLEDYGYLRLLEFLDDGKTVQVRTYCTNGTWLTDPANQFQFELTEFRLPRLRLTNGDGATNVTGSAVDLTGYLASTGAAPTTVYVFWGTSNGVDVIDDWGNTTQLDADGVGPLTVAVPNLAANTRYYYRFFATNAIGGSWGSPLQTFTTSGVIPFTDDFEERLEGDLDGQYGWTTTGAAVQTNEVVEGVHAMGIEGWQSEASHQFEEGRTQVWTDLRCRPVFGAPASAPPAGSTFAFYVNTNGVVVAFDGSTQTQLVGAVVQSNAWARFTVYSDHVNTNWCLWVNGVSAASNLGFYSAGPGSYGELVLNGSSAGATYMDDVNIGLRNPLSRTATVLFGK